MLIVEDERWEREGLAHFLDWPALGIGNVETAFDGIDGLEKALLLRPDIIVTDIQMPGMNGLEMAKQIREALPQVHIVILTGYDDFDYAREAIRFHAAEYLLKPVEEAEMLAVMTRVTGKCQEERLLRLEEAHKLDRLEAGHVAFLRHALSDLLTGRAEGLVPAAELELYLAGYGELKPAAYDLVALRAAAEIRSDWLERRAEEVLGRPVLLVALPEGGNADYALLYTLEAGEEKRQREQAQLLLNGLSGADGRNGAGGAETSVTGSLPGGAWIMVYGSSAQSLEQLSAACALAARSLGHAVWTGLSGIVAAGEEEAARKRFAEDPEGLSRGFKELEKHIRSALGSGQVQEAGAATAEIFDLIAAYPGAGRPYIGSLLGGLLDNLQVLAAPGLQEKVPGSLEELLACESREQMKQQMLSRLHGIASRLQEKREHKEDYVVDRIIRLVEERYGNPELSLAYLAAEVFVSANHLGMLFKKSTGRTPIEYIQDYRLSRAEELLRTTKQRVSVIAEKVGIPNTSYFGTLFKQSYGMSPGEYQVISQR
jgi:two-component system response regulator YesN